MADDPALPTGLRLTPLDPVFREAPHVYLDRLRDEDPVHRDEQLGRLFLTRHADVRAILGDRGLSVDPRKAAPDSYHRRVVGGNDPDWQPSMLHLDDPDHGRIRGLVSQAFNQRSVERFRPRVRAIAEGLLDQVQAEAGLDLIAAFAAPLPTIVIAEMLGVDPRDQARFKRWSDAQAHVFNPQRTPEQTAALQEASEGLIGFFATTVEQRRQNRGTDLISALVSAEEAGQRLSTQEIITTCNLLLVAGNITTTDLIGNAVLALLRHPEQMAALRARPELVRNAVEETLRYDPPVAQVSRVVVQETEIGGVRVPPGTSLNGSLLAAGHDPAAHDEPDRFDIARPDPGHLSFGGGAHFCLGAPLARAEAQIALSLLLERFPVLALDPAHAVVHKRAPVFNGLEALWVRAG